MKFHIGSKISFKTVLFSAVNLLFNIGKVVLSTIVLLNIEDI